MSAVAAELPEAQRVEFRCPVPEVSGTGVRHVGPLFAVVLLSSGHSLDVGANLVEIACQRCKQRLVRMGVPARRVIHRYSLAGELVETLVEGAREVLSG